MNMLVFTALITFGIFSPCLSLDYSELVRLNASCPFADSCRDRMISEDNTVTSNCECGPYCKRYSTCCIDSPYIGDTRRTKTATVPQRFECLVLEMGYKRIFAVTKCNPRWRGNPQVKNMCERKLTSLQDPLVLTPGTNLKSHTTYKNYFCAMCNNDDEEISMWQIQLSVYPTWDEQQDGIEIDTDLVKENLVFNSTINQWGFYHQAGSTRDFRIVILNLMQPLDASSEQPDIFRTCTPGRVISTCHRNWRDQNIRDKCRAYMALLNHPQSTYGNEIYYRNVHCAMCNFESGHPQELCIQRTSGSGFGGAGPSMSLSILLDVNMSKGNKVGEVNDCGKGQLRDPFARKCRTLGCGLPGFVKKGNRCVRV